MAINKKDPVKQELKELFNEGMLMTLKDVTSFLDMTRSALQQQIDRGNLVEIYGWNLGKTMYRLFYYPDIIAFKKYHDTKKKNDTYEVYHKQIQTSERYRVQQLLRDNVWTANQTRQHLGVTLATLNRHVKSGRLNVLYQTTAYRAFRLFYIPDVKRFKVKFDMYSDYMKRK
ncbi:hypothetical protein GCM10025886_14250 [Tetragenococcus halophilus subsp. flandriensis]|uniref:hypothetical protein n=1 Tax=Tetragenococcus halophilus TaxID=51669 RepID=UPI0023E906E6|nr:hypothetical protein [Tetragenococcus halophilus]GMA08274.1 hypothetical protein GCM10025886_14250 [Tetragenococcus halophilus subsp. flandriensis]